MPNEIKGGLGPIIILNGAPFLGETIWRMRQINFFTESYFRCYIIRNNQNESFLMQTPLVPSQFGVAEHIPNIIMTYKSDLETVEVREVGKITQRNLST